MSAVTRVLLAGMGMALILIGFVIDSGSTFGQRCAQAYHDPAQQEWCVERLAHGGLVYPHDEGHLR